MERVELIVAEHAVPVRIHCLEPLFGIAARRPKTLTTLGWPHAAEVTLVCVGLLTSTPHLAGACALTTTIARPESGSAILALAHSRTGALRVALPVKATSRNLIEVLSRTTALATSRTLVEVLPRAKAASRTLIEVMSLPTSLATSWALVEVLSRTEATPWTLSYILSLPTPLSASWTLTEVLPRTEASSWTLREVLPLTTALAASRTTWRRAKILKGHSNFVLRQSAVAILVEVLQDSCGIGPGRTLAVTHFRRGRRHVCGLLRDFRRWRSYCGSGRRRLGRHPVRHACRKQCAEQYGWDREQT